MQWLRWSCACLLLSSALAQAAPSLDAAERAAAQVHWAEARTEVEAVMRGGGLDRVTLLAAYELRAEIAAVIEGAAAAEREYAKLLSLDPARSGPRRSSPVFTQPFAHAQKWLAENGALRMIHEAPSKVAAGVSLTLDVRLADPLALAAGVRAVGRVGTQPFVLGSPPRLPALDAGATVAYRLEALDSFGNILAVLGEDAPFSAAAEPPPALRLRDAAPAPSLPLSLRRSPPSRRRLWRPAVGLAAASLALLGGAIGLNVAARDEYDSLRGSCAPHCTEGQLGLLHGEEDGAIALYAIAGAGAVASVLLLLLDRLHR